MAWRAPEPLIDREPARAGVKKRLVLKNTLGACCSRLSVHSAALGVRRLSLLPMDRAESGAGKDPRARLHACVMLNELTVSSRRNGDLSGQMGDDLVS